MILGVIRWKGGISIENWKKIDPCYRVAMSVAELHPSGFMENQK